MMYSIENDVLKVSFKARCGELASIINKRTNTEFMWQADPTVWAWHAPVLFPIVGGLKNDTLFVDGNSFKMGRHGFFRNSTPEIEEHSERHIVFLLKSSQETKTVYPFEFEFRIRFELNEMSLTQRFIVTNTDYKPIYFALGGHPAFKVPFYENESYSDYYLEFENSETLKRHLLSSEGLFNGETEVVKFDSNRLPLTYDLFAKDALVFKDIKTRKVSIKSRKHQSSLNLFYPDFPYLGLWAKHGANFVCIEPWIGCADTIIGHVDISAKEKVIKLNNDSAFETFFEISINE